MILTARAFKELIVKGEKPPATAEVRKLATGMAEAVANNTRALRFKLSTATPDREFDSIRQEGWVLDPYLANPVVLFGHDQGAYPVGRAFDVSVENGVLKGSVEFVPFDIPEAGPRAEAVFQLCSRGFLSATSVGFRPLNWDVPKGDSARGNEFWPGVDYLKQELVEFSIVPVPCNPEALIEPMSVFAGVEAAFEAAAEKDNSPEIPDERALHVRAQRRRLVDVLALG